MVRLRHQKGKILILRACSIPAASDPDNTISFLYSCRFSSLRASDFLVMALCTDMTDLAVVGYSITADGLSKLTLTGLDEGFRWMY
ncbi:hypothetical protein O9929_25055 [Vibrio lentus]|nr:hypothetical protein [Vibrio lentus]